MAAYSLEIIESDDLVMGISGTMHLIKEPLECSKAMALWEMNVEKVKQDTSPVHRVTRGAAAVLRSEKGQAFEQAAIAEVMAATKGN